MPIISNFWEKLCTVWKTLKLIITRKPFRFWLHKILKYIQVLEVPTSFHVTMTFRKKNWVMKALFVERRICFYWNISRSRTKELIKEQLLYIANTTNHSYAIHCVSQTKVFHKGYQGSISISQFRDFNDFVLYYSILIMWHHCNYRI